MQLVKNINNANLPNSSTGLHFQELNSLPDSRLVQQGDADIAENVKKLSLEQERLQKTMALLELFDLGRKEYKVKNTKL